MTASVRDAFINLSHGSGGKAMRDLIDDVIDPAESRTWIRNGMRFRSERTGATHDVRTIDTW